MKLPMRVLNHAIALLLVALVYHQTCLAQVNPWERVKLIEPGKSVHVKLHTGKTVKGKMEAWNADGLSVRQGKGKVVEVAKSDVAQVAMVGGMSRGNKAVYGFLVGGAAGAALGGAACAGGDGCDVSPAAVAVGTAILVGGIAALVAAAFPQHKEVVYTAEFTPSADGGSEK